MYENILYPTDGSDGAAAAMGTVQNLAETYGSTVHVLNVVDTRYEGLGSDSPEAETGHGRRPRRRYGRHGR